MTSLHDTIRDKPHLHSHNDARASFRTLNLERSSLTKASPRRCSLSTAVVGTSLWTPALAIPMVETTATTTTDLLTQRTMVGETTPADVHLRQTRAAMHPARPEAAGMEAEAAATMASHLQHELILKMISVLPTGRKALTTWDGP